MPSFDNRFGKYELLARIAAGGMAEIFKARYEPAPGVSRSVVIKRILPHYAANTQFIQMFTNEARIAMGLSHGNIAQVFDFGELDGDWFLAMEYVDGQPVSKLQKRARAFGMPVIPTPCAVAITIELLKGLHYAHARLDEQGKPLKIVHRDVSPQNVLVSYEGQVKIVDFGIAKARNATRDDTEAGAVKGKYAYFAPEQARTKELDARTDIFATGIFLYEMLTGQLPFQGKMMEALGKIVRGEFVRPRALNPAIPVELEAILLKAMANEKAERYQTAEDFAQALSSWLNQAEPTFTPATLAHLVALLFEQELVAEGRPPILPKAFVEAAAAWKKPLPVPAGGQTTDSQAPGAQLRKRKRAAGNDESTEPEYDVRQLRRLLLFAGVPALAAALSALGVSLYARTGVFSVQLTSSPAQARVRVDGVLAPKVTPLLIEGLAAGRPHKLQLELLGHLPWSAVVQPARGTTLPVHAALLPEEPAAPVAPTPPPEPTPSSPSTHLVLDAAALQLKFAELSARVALDPRKPTRITKESGGELLYLLEGSRPDRLGVLGSKPLEVRSATSVRFFAVEGGARKLKLAAKGARPTLLTVEPGKRGVAPAQRLAVPGTPPYSLTLKSSTTERVLVGQGERIGLLEVGGAAVRIERPEPLWLALPQELGGTVEIDVTP